MRIVVLIKAARALPDAVDRLPALAPCDAAALEWAVALAGDGDETIAITAGPESAQPALERALDRGLDRAVRIWVPDPDVQLLDANVRGVAELLAATVRHIGPIDLVLCGARSADWGSGITGPAVAFELAIPHLSYLSSIQPIQPIQPAEPAESSDEADEERGEDADESGDSAPKPPSVIVVQHRDARVLEWELQLPALLSVVSAPPERVERARPEGATIEVLMADEVGFEADDPLPWPALPTSPDEGAARRVNAEELLALLTADEHARDESRGDEAGADPP